MQKRLILLLLLLTFRLSGALSIQMEGGLYLPQSNYISQYLEPGHGLKISVITKKDFWPLSLEFNMGYNSFTLKDKPDSTLDFSLLTIALLYKLPLNLKSIELSPFIEAGINIERLETPTSKEYNSAFYSAVGIKADFMMTKSFQPGLTFKWILNNEIDETASFLYFGFHFTLQYP